MYRRVLTISLLLVITACRTKPKSAPQLDAAGASLGASEIAIGDPVYQPVLLRGFYESEGGWRWTARKFAVAI